MNESLIEFIAKQSGTKQSEVLPDAELERDLGIYGDDAVELVIAYAKQFNVDVSQFMAADYISSESDTILPGIIRFISGTKSIKKDFLVHHLEKGVIAGKLNEDIINTGSSIPK